MTYSMIPVHACTPSHRAHCLTLSILRLFSLTRHCCYNYLQLNFTSLLISSIFFYAYIYTLPYPVYIELIQFHTLLLLLQ